jgi:hypothetical protein
MNIVVIVLFVAALVCFLLAAGNVPTSPRLNILGLGLFFLTIAFALGVVKGVS